MVHFHRIRHVGGVPGVLGNKQYKDGEPHRRAGEREADLEEDPRGREEEDPRGREKDGRGFKERLDQEMERLRRNRNETRGLVQGKS